MKKHRICQFLIFGALSLLLLIGGISVSDAQAATIDVGSAATTDASGSCNNTNQADNSLRLAICYANANAGDHTINLANTTYTLTLTGADEDGNDTGDLDIDIGSGNTLTINGNGATIDAQDNSAVGRVIHILSGNVVFNNVTITGADTVGRGGGIFIASAGSIVTLNNCVITGNTVELSTSSGDGGGGGGIDNNGGILTLNNCTVSDNKSTRNGGGIYTLGGTVNIYKSTISGNEATNSDSYGGGIYQRDSGVLLLQNSTISDNSAYEGGGIFAFSSSGSPSITLHSCTVVNNSAGSRGGGISRWSTGGYGTIRPVLTNTIIANNTGGTAPDCYTNNITSNGYNLIENTTGFGGTLTTVASDITGVDPLLDALADNGGPTQTHALQAGSPASPAVDAGGSCLAADQRGTTRPQGATCDIGAYESINVELTITVAPSAFVETDGAGAAIASVTRSDTTGTVVIKLTSSDTSRAKVAGAESQSITLFDGQATAEFSIDAVADADADDNTVTLTATEEDPPTGDITGYQAVSTEVTVTETTPTPTPTSAAGAKALMIEVQSARLTEGGKSAIVTVKLSDGADGVDVRLSSGSSADLTVGGSASQTVTSSGGGVATFTIQAIDDATVEGLETVGLAASATGYTGAGEDVFIRDSGAMSGDSLTFPSFVLHASYDWLHNFHDNNMSASGAAGDLDSDNFNKLIMLDSNLFPIYTALQGDAEMPNTVMRNWTTGPGGYSPSVNDYMNRSVAAAADYMNYTSKIPFGYGSLDALEAVGMRSYLQWVYTVDPANHNFRRYKFVNIQDTVPDYAYWDSSVGTFIDKSGDPSFTGTDDSQGTKCPTCDPNYWYVVDYDQSVNAYDTKCPESCYDDDGDGVADTKFLMYAKIQDDGMTDSGIDPPVRFQVPVAAQAIDTQATVDVSMTLKGFKTANDATMSFFLNSDSVDTGCQQGPTTAGTENSDYGIASGGCGNTKGACRPEVNISFTNVPTSCASNCNTQYCYMTIDMMPLDKNHGGWFIELPNYHPPEDVDNAFRIPVVGFDNITGAEWEMLSDTEKEEKIAQRWANIDGYLDVMPPKSYPGYPNYTARIGYGYRTNTTFSSADNVRFKNPRDIAVFRDYFDQANGGPVYIFVADTFNHRIQVFMNATGSAGDPAAAFPIRPVPVKGPNDTSVKTIHKSNELGLRIYSSNDESLRFGDGRKADWRQYTTLPGDTFVNITTGKGEFYAPHSIAVDQDPDTKDVYLFVADTYNHRIQVFRDVSGVSSQAITAKKFDFRFEKGWGTYPLQTTEAMTPPGPYNFRYPKGVSVARFKNNSSYLYVVDSKNYRLMKYEIGESGSGGISGVQAVSGYGYDGTKFVKNLLTNAGQPMTAHNTNPGFWNPQDVATGYSGFFNYTSPHGKGTKFLNNYMVYVTDYARNMTSLTRDRLNMRVMQFIQVPGVYQSISGVWIPWETESFTNFSTGYLGQSVYGISDGAYDSTGGGGSGSTGSTENTTIDGKFTDRPVGITALQWNTLKPIDIRVADATGSNPYLPGQSLPRTTELRIGVSSRKLSFGYPENNRTMFMGYSTQWTELTGDWDATDTGRVHLFCYDKDGAYITGSHTHADGVLEPSTPTSDTPYLVTLSDLGCVSGGFLKIVVEDEDFNFSARTGTAFYGVQ